MQPITVHSSQCISYLVTSDCCLLQALVCFVFGVRVGRGVPIFEERWNYYMTYSFLQVQLSVIMGIPFQDFLFQR